MAKLPSTGAPAPDPTFIDLTRMLARLQQTLITPDLSTEARLRAASYEREKVAINLDHARTLLLRLEQDAQSIKVQSRKQEVQADLVRKREMIQRLSERLQELNELGDYVGEQDSSEGEDLLGEDTPSDETDDVVSHEDIKSEPAETTDTTDPPPLPLQTDLTPRQPSSESHVDTTTETSSTLRSRNARSELLARSSTNTGQSTGISTATTEALLTHSRLEQESLTSSLLSMAQALKASSHSFASSLESEKTIVDRAVEGLDKNEIGMDAAQKRMGYLRTMTEGRGWWGRMLMYGWIAGLMVLALVIVFVLPKLRF